MSIVKVKLVILKLVNSSRKSLSSWKHEVNRFVIMISLAYQNKVNSTWNVCASQAFECQQPFLESMIFIKAFGIISYLQNPWRSQYGDIIMPRFRVISIIRIKAFAFRQMLITTRKAEDQICETTKRKFCE